MGKRLPGDALGVKRIRLALATPLVVLSRARRTAVAHVVAALTQERRGVTTDPAGALDTPARHGSKTECPPLESAMSFARDREVLGCQEPATLVEYGRRQRVLVGIDPDDVSFDVTTLALPRCFHSSLPSPRVEGTGRQLPVEKTGATLLSSQAATRFQRRSRTPPCSKPAGPRTAARSCRPGGGPARGRSGQAAF